MTPSTHAVVLQEGERPDYRHQAVPMLLHGLHVGSRRVSRREVRRHLRRVVGAWWTWTTAWSGDLFWDIQRDLLVQIHQGVGRHRTVRVVCAEATHYPVVQRLGLDAVFALTKPERCTYSWQDLVPVPSLQEETRDDR